MNTQEQNPAPELPVGYRPVETVEPEALEVSASMLCDPKQQCSRRMRKNMWSLRSRLLMSLAPIVRVESTEGELLGYAWNTQAQINSDVKLERRLACRNLKQLLKLRSRSTKRAARLQAKLDAGKFLMPAMQQRVRDAIASLRNAASAADSEIRFERLNESAFKNPDGN